MYLSIRHTLNYRLVVETRENEAASKTTWTGRPLYNKWDSYANKRAFRIKEGTHSFATVAKW